MGSLASIPGYKNPIYLSHLTGTPRGFKNAWNVTVRAWNVRKISQAVAQATRDRPALVTPKPDGLFLTVGGLETRIAGFTGYARRMTGNNCTEIRIPEGLSPAQVKTLLDITADNTLRDCLLKLRGFLPDAQIVFNTDENTFIILAIDNRGPNHELKRILIQNPRTPASALTSIYESCATVEMRCDALLHKNTRKSALDNFHRRFSKEMQIEMAKRESAPDEILDDLLDSDIKEVREAVAINPKVLVLINFARITTDDEAIDLLTKNPIRLVRAEAAKRTKNGKCIAELFCDSRFEVQWALAENPNVLIELLEQISPHIENPILKEHFDKIILTRQISEAATSRSSARLLYLINIGHPSILLAAAGNPHLSEGCFGAIAACESPEVISKLLRHSKLPLGMLFYIYKNGPTTDIQALALRLINGRSIPK